MRPPPVHLVTIQSFLGTPGSSLGSPSASGAASGDSFFGGSYQGRTRGTQDVDAEFGLGMGFGDPEGGVALEADLASFSTARHPPFTTGGVSFKLHRRVPEHLLLVAVGVENALSWGQADGGRSFYGTVSRIIRLRPNTESPFGVLSTSIGVGNGRFRSWRNVQDSTSGVNVFGGVGLRIMSQLAATADWTGQDLNAGFTIMPIRGTGVVVSLGAADLTHSAGSGARFIASVGYGFRRQQDSRVLSEEDRRAAFKSP